MNNPKNATDSDEYTADNSREQPDRGTRRWCPSLAGTEPEIACIKRVGHRGPHEGKGGLIGWWDSAAEMERPSRHLRIKPIFAWYDLWVGVFVDRQKRRVYVFPLPCLGLVVTW